MSWPVQFPDILSPVPKIVASLILVIESGYCVFDSCKYFQKVIALGN